MKNVKVSELSGSALDWTVAKCEGGWILDLSSFVPNHSIGRMNFSGKWDQGGPIIENEKIAIDFDSGIWCSSVNTKPIAFYGSTPLIAAMRCYVASKLGDTISIPEQLA